jgi:hypothetical protein
MPDVTPTPEAIEAAAQAAHEAARAFRRAVGDPPHPSWDDAPGWQREQAQETVRAIAAGAGLVDLHDRWRAAMEADGWTYGEVEDVGAKRHPSLRPLSEIPLDRRSKPYVYAMAAKAVLHALGY